MAALLLVWTQSVPAIAASTSASPFHLGITVEHVTDGLQVNEVQVDSVSEKAGLLPGDLILLMDGRKAKALTPEQIGAAFSGTYDKPVVFVIRRAGSEKLEIRVAP